MRRGGTLRGVAAAWLGLIALHAVGTRGGSGRVAEFFTDVTGLIERVLDADVPGIPDRRAAAASSSSTPSPLPGGYGSADAAERWIAGGRLPVPSVPTPPK